MPTHKNILVIGATSAIAEATARLWAGEGAQLYLVARNADKLSLVARDLETRGARVAHALLDVNEFDRHAPIVEAAFDAMTRMPNAFNRPARPSENTATSALLDP